jgi:hypothetical protein
MCFSRGPRVTLLLLLASQFAFDAGAASNPYTPLWLYNGAWRVTRAGVAPGTKPDELVNQCALVGKYFTCQQTVNGEPGALLIFVPANEPGHYYTQNVGLDARATRRGDLEIERNRWTYSSTWNQGGTTTYYKTVNTFTGGDRIHFEQLESKNNKDWKATGSGDEVRIARPAKKPIR